MNPLTIVALAAFVAGIFTGTYKPFAGFKKGPPTAELVASQAALADAQKKAKDAQDAKEQAVAAERQRQEGQLRLVQKDVAGARAAISRVGEATPELRVAKMFVGQIDIKLAVVIGKLPDAEAAAMIELVNGLIADSEESKAKLAKLNEQFAVVSAERDAIKAQIPTLTDRASKAEGKVVEIQKEAANLSSKVTDWANKTFAKEKEAGSLGAALERALFWLTIAAIIIWLWISCAWWLPKLLDFLPSGQLKNFARHTAGTISGGAWYIDAHQKLTAANKKDKI